MARSRTIQIFLKDADPNGIKIAELGSSIAQVYVIPRDKLSFIAKRPELSSPGIYLLFDDDRTSVYIGESENFATRIKGHDASKDFWHWALVAISKDKSLDKADVKFLEHHIIAKAINAGRMDVRNVNVPNQTSLHEFKEADVMGFFDDIELLISTLGFNIFEPHKDILKPIVDKKSEHNYRASDPASGRKFDTIVCPANSSLFVRQTFFDHSRWHAVRIGRDKIDKIKYVALYEAAPESKIRYYANVTKIEPNDEYPNKYTIHHDGKIIELDRHVALGEHHQLSLQGPRYFCITDIESSKTLKELTDRAFGGDYQGPGSG